MTRKFLVLLSVFAFAFSYGRAQVRCVTDEMHRKFLREHPEMAQKIADDSARLEDQIKMQIGNFKVSMDMANLARLTSDSANPMILDDTLFIPVVVHIIHNYGNEFVSDDNAFLMIKTLNDYYQLKNDTSTCFNVTGAGTVCGIIPAFRKYVGRPNIYFKLATKDPNGNPTKGITRRYSFAAYGGDNAAKFDLWAPSNYMNIWIEAVIGQAADGNGVVAAYSQLPPVGAADPFVDGLITAYPYIGAGANAANSAYVIAHEVGHYFNLLHPFGDNNSGNAASGCGDDGVDDTPPTTGEFGDGHTIKQFYDTMCARGYAKVYASHVPGIDSLVDYPDTANVQNIMTYSDFTPELMFTKGQVIRMRAALSSDVAHRNNLWTPSNLARTGAMDPVPDMPLTIDYSVSGGGSSSPNGWGPTNGLFTYATTFNGLFVCEGQAVSFKNQSWNDTVDQMQWSFSNGASTNSSTSLNTVTGIKFSQPGWVTVTITGTGNNTAPQTLVDSSKVFVADDNATSSVGYIQEFNAGGDLGKWPTFNYYNNNFKWSLNTTTGYYDHTSMQYIGFDDRIYPSNLISPAHVGATHVGDYDDMFTPKFNLSDMVNSSDSTIYLSFLYAGATRTGFTQNITDTLEISYNNNCGNIWTKVKTLTKADIINQGAQATAFTPTWFGQWSLQQIAIPKAAITDKTVFRFRYKPGVDQYGNSSGNNFFMDRIHFTKIIEPLDVNTLNNQGLNVVVSPNPTNGNAFVTVADAANATVNIQVTDITGKVVFSAQQKNNSTASRIEIPHSAIAVSGIYMVHVTTDNQVRTEKLVVY